MANLEERVFDQKFDVILKRTRLTFDIEKDKYPEGTVTFFLNGSTGEKSSRLEDVVREGIEYTCEEYDQFEDKSSRGYSMAYDEKQELLFLYLLEKVISPFHTDCRQGYEEVARYAIDSRKHIYRKPNSLNDWSRGRSYVNTQSMKACLVNDGTYQESSDREYLPMRPDAFVEKFPYFVNEENGSNKGLSKIMQNIFPAMYNISGNKYNLINDYASMCDYLKIMEEGIRCIKKSGKKQNYIDKMVAIEMPEIKPEDFDENELSSRNGYAVIQKVPGADEPTCCIRTMIYSKDEGVSFEGGRIYVTKKTAEFCKKNNMGDWVHQPFPQKINHWDFSILLFNEEETKGTMLEYFGQILPNILPGNRAVSIYAFIKNPLIESLGKIFSPDFINNLIEEMIDSDDMGKTLNISLGICKPTNKALQALGINKNQLDVLQDIMSSAITAYKYYQDDDYVAQYAMFPFLKKMLVSNANGDISSVDIETFKRYVAFSTDVYSSFDIFDDESSIARMITQIIKLKDRVIERFTEYNVEKLFPVFLDMIKRAGKCGYSTSYYCSAGNYVRTFNDYMTMLSGIPDYRNYKPEFTNEEELKIAHENIQIVRNMMAENWNENVFVDRHKSWVQWEWEKPDVLYKDGRLKEKGFPFIVVAPKKPLELATEGTRLHHCVKSYIDKVVNGVTNIMFIRKADDPETPFFTVEVTNEKKIEQVHGSCNRNANTEPGLTEFVHAWADKKHLKLHNIDKVR